MRRTFATIAFIAVASTWRLLGAPPLPNDPGSFKFAVLGDNGSGDQGQMDVAARMALLRGSFPYEIVVMLGDNFYGSQRPSELVRKFDEPYKPLLGAGVTFHAVLGNHDETHTINYPPLNMAGRRYYSFTRKGTRFFMLDTNMVDAAQLRWFETELDQSQEEWKIAILHHALYSNAGRHGSNLDLRVLIEPLLLKGGVNVVFSGHDHIYERLKPQKGIHYFVAGSGGKLRKGDLKRSESTAAGFDQDQAFMMVEVIGDEMYFETVSRVGETVDSGTIRRSRTRIETAARTP